MEITPIGFLLLLVVFAVMYSKEIIENLFLLCLTVDVFIETGYAIKLGNDKYYFLFTLTEYVLSFCCMIKIVREHVRIDKNWCLLACSYIIPVIILFFFPSDAWVTPRGVYIDDVLYGNETLIHPVYSTDLLKSTIIYIIFLVIPIYLYHYYSFFDYKKLIKRFSKIVKIFLFFGVVEYLVKNIFGGNAIWGDFIDSFFGSYEFSVSEGRLRGDSFELNLFTREASHYAYSLFLSACVLFVNNVISGHNKGLSFSVILCFLLIFLSTSFSSLLFVAGFFMLWLIYRWGILRPSSLKKEIYISIIGISVLMILSPVIFNMDSDGFIGGRFFNLINNFEDFFTSDINYGVRLGDSSSQARIFSVVQALVAFATRPLFGLSLGIVTCHGSTASFIAGVGILGLYFWIKAFFFSCPLGTNLQTNKLYFLLGIIIYLLINMMNSLAIRPFYNTTLPLMVIFMCQIFSEKIVRHKGS